LRQRFAHHPGRVCCRSGLPPFVLTQTGYSVEGASASGRDQSRLLDQPRKEGAKVAIPTTGAFMRVPPIEPSKGAAPNENTPPSLAASQ